MLRHRGLLALIGLVLSIALTGCLAPLQQFLLQPTSTAPAAHSPTSVPPPVVTRATAAPAILPTNPAPAPTSAPIQPAVAEPPLQPANALEGQIEGVYRQAGPAVVNITSQVITYDFFNQPVPQEGTGSGFFYDGQGHIVTNYHVIADAQSVSVALKGGESYPAEIVGSDPSTDLAVLKVDLPDQPEPLTLADSDQLNVGQFVVAIGNPFGLEQTLTVGVISSLGRVIQSPDGRFIGEAIQTDAAINPGNSGGPLLDLNGRVIGVNSQIISPSQASAGIGFAVSANTVQRVAPQLIAQGRYPHPWLGVRLLDITPERADIFSQAGVQLPVDKGIMIMELVTGGPAAKAKLRAGSRTVVIGNTSIPVGGDIIVALNGRPVTSIEQLTTTLDATTQVGQAVTLTIYRGDKKMDVSVTLQERSDQP